MRLPESDRLFRKIIDCPVAPKHTPVKPGNGVVLTVGVVVAALGVAKFIAGFQKRRTLTQQQQKQGVANLFCTEFHDLPLAGGAFHAAVPAEVVIRAVPVSLAVGLVVLAVIGDQIRQRKTVGMGHIVDGSRLLRDSDDALRHRADHTFVSLQETAHILFEAVIILREPARRTSRHRGCSCSGGRRCRFRGRDTPHREPNSIPPRSPRRNSPVPAGREQLHIAQIWVAAHQIRRHISHQMNAVQVKFPHPVTHHVQHKGNTLISAEEQLHDQFHPVDMQFFHQTFQLPHRIFPLSGAVSCLRGKIKPVRVSPVIQPPGNCRLRERSLTVLGDYLPELCHRKQLHGGHTQVFHVGNLPGDGGKCPLIPHAGRRVLRESPRMHPVDHAIFHGNSGARILSPVEFIDSHRRT